MDADRLLVAHRWSWVGCHGSYCTLKRRGTVKGTVKACNPCRAAVEVRWAAVGVAAASVRKPLEKPGAASVRRWRLRALLAERDTGVEPVSQPWEGWARPIYQSRNSPIL